MFLFGFALAAFSAAEGDREVQAGADAAAGNDAYEANAAVKSILAGAQVPGEEADTKKVTGRKGGFGPAFRREKGEIKKEVMSLGISPYKMLMALIIMAGVLGGFFYFLKKIGHRFTGSDTGSGLKVKSRLQLDTKNAVVLVKVYEEELVLGVGSNGVNLLSKLAPINYEDEEENDVDAEIVEENDSQRIPFAKRLVDSVKSMDIKSLGGVL